MKMRGMEMNVFITVIADESSASREYLEARIVLRTAGGMRAKRKRIFEFSSERFMSSEMRIAMIGERRNLKNPLRRDGMR